MFGSQELSDDDVEELTKCLDDDHSGRFDRKDALRRLDRHGAFPVDDPNDDETIMILGADVRSGSGRGAEPYGDWVKEIVKVVHAHCSECGYDRATYRYNSNGSDWGRTKHCRSCDTVITNINTF